MKVSLVLTILGPDRTGLVDAVADAVAVAHVHVSVSVSTCTISFTSIPTSTYIPTTIIFISISNFIYIHHMLHLLLL